MLKKKTNEELLREIIELGYELEGVDYNSKFEGYEGFEASTRNRERQALRAKAKRRIIELKNRGINVWDNDYSYTDDRGIEWELEYALQFM